MLNLDLKPGSLTLVPIVKNSLITASHVITKGIQYINFYIHIILNKAR